MTPARSSARPPLPRRPFILLGLMTTATLVGPLLIGWVLPGGTRPNWPPDRPVEWLTVIGTSGTVLGLMLACLALARTNKKPTADIAPVSPPNQPSGSPPAFAEPRS